MAENFYTILTNTGKAQIANASALGIKVNFTTLKLGDGNGAYYNPTETQTTLVHEVWSGNIGNITVDSTNANWLVLETVIPADVGGFMIREAGVFDDKGNLLAVGKYPETYKPIVSQGSAKDLRIRIIIEVTNTAAVTLKVDPAVILATKKEVGDLVNLATTSKGNLVAAVNENTLNAKSFKSIDLKYIARFFTNSPAVVTDANDPVYAASGLTNVPIGGVFNNINPTTKKLSDTIDLPATCWAIVSLCKVYGLDANTEIKSIIEKCADFIANNLQDGSFYGANFKYIPNGFTHSNGTWAGTGWGYHVRVQYQAIWALLEAYKISPKLIYKTAIEELLDQAAVWQQNISTRITNGEIAGYMNGAVYNTISNTEGSFAPEWTSFSNTSIDVIYKAITNYVTLFGNAQRSDIEGISYYPQSILNNHKNWFIDCYNNHGMRRTTGHNMLYSFYKYDAETGPFVNGVANPTAMNWDWIEGGWSTETWFTGDLQLWAIKGMAYCGFTDQVKSLLDRFYQLRVTTNDERILFYDRYTKDGGHLADDQSISTVFTALYMNCRELINDTSYSQACFDTVYLKQIKSIDVLIDGGYNWDATDEESLLETKSLGEIVYAPIEKYASSSSIQDILQDNINMFHETVKNTGNLALLNTVNKENLVAAINENTSSLAEKAAQKDIDNAILVKKEVYVARHKYIRQK
ncbi:phage tail protein, partial [Clostridium magnum]